MEEVAMDEADSYMRILRCLYLYSLLSREGFGTIPFAGSSPTKSEPLYILGK
jgi:hypothetical protein